jgi:hypothetical protein
MKTYPDITKIIEAKKRRRRALAELSFEEKIAIVNKWRQLSARIKEYRGPIEEVSKREGKKV